MLISSPTSFVHHTHVPSHTLSPIAVAQVQQQQQQALQHQPQSTQLLPHSSSAHHTLLHDFPRHTASTIAASIVSLLDTDPSCCINWSRAHVDWSMECLGYACSATPVVSIPLPLASGISAAAAASSSAEDTSAYALVHGVTRIYARWLLSPYRPTCIAGDIDIKKKIITQLGLVFGGVRKEQQLVTSIIQTATSSGGNTTTQPSSSVNSSTSFSPSSATPGSGASHLPPSNSHIHHTAAAATAASLSASTLSDSRSITLCTRVLGIYHRLGRSLSPVSNEQGKQHEDETIWNVLIEAVLGIASVVLVQSSVKRSPQSSSSSYTSPSSLLEPFLIRVLFELLLRSQTMDSGLWSRFALTVRKTQSVHAAECWQRCMKALMRKVWRGMETAANTTTTTTNTTATAAPTAVRPSGLSLSIAQSQSPTLIQPPIVQPPHTDRVTFIWPVYSVGNNATPSTAAASDSYTSVSSAYFAAGSTTTVFYTRGKMVWTWKQWMNVYELKGMKEMCATAALVKQQQLLPQQRSGGQQNTSAQQSTYSHAVQLSSTSSPSAQHLSSTASQLGSGKKEPINRAGAVSPHHHAKQPSSNPASFHSIESHTSVPSASDATPASSLIPANFDRSRSASIYRSYTEGYIYMVQTFLARSMRRQIIREDGNIEVKTLPQNRKFLLQVFGEKLFTLAEAFVQPTNTPMQNMTSAADDTSPLDDFSYSHCLAFGCLLRLFSTKYYRSDNASVDENEIDLLSVTRLYRLVRRYLQAVNRASSRRTPTPSSSLPFFHPTTLHTTSSLILHTLFYHSYALFTSGLPGVHVFLCELWMYVKEILKAQTSAPEGASTTATSSAIGQTSTTTAGKTGVSNTSSAPNNTSPQPPSSTSTASSSSSHPPPSLTSQQKRYKLLTSIRLMCVRLLNIIPTLHQLAERDCERLILIQERKEKERLSGEEGSAASNSSSSLFTHDAFLQHHSSAIMNSMSFFTSIASSSSSSSTNSSHTSINHLLIDALFSEQNELNLDEILEAIERRLMGVGKNGSGNEKATQQTQSSAATAQSAPSAFPHLSFTTVWKLLISDIWSSRTQLRALLTLRRMAAGGGSGASNESSSDTIGDVDVVEEIHAWNQASIVNWIVACVKWMEKKLNEVTSSTSTTTTTTSATSSSPTKPGVRSGIAALHHTISLHRILHVAFACLHAWIRRVPSVLLVVTPTIASANQTSTGTAPPPPHGSVELTRSLVEIIIRSVQYSLGEEQSTATSSSNTTSKKPNTNTTTTPSSPDDSAARNHLLSASSYHRKLILTECRRLLQFILFESSSSSSSSLAMKSAPLLLHSSFRPPTSSLGSIFNGIISSSSSSASTTSSSINERILLRHLINEGYLPSYSTPANSIRWCVLNGKAIVSCIQFSTLPIYKRGGQIIKAQAHHSTPSTHSLLFTIRDASGKREFYSQKIYLPAPTNRQKEIQDAIEKSRPLSPSFLPRTDPNHIRSSSLTGGRYMFAEDQHDDQFWSALCYLQGMNEDGTSANATAAGGINKPTTTTTTGKPELARVSSIDAIQMPPAALSTIIEPPTSSSTPPPPPLPAQTQQHSFSDAPPSSSLSSDLDDTFIPPPPRDRRNTSVVPRSPPPIITTTLKSLESVLDMNDEMDNLMNLPPRPRSGQSHHALVNPHQTNTSTPPTGTSASSSPAPGTPILGPRSHSHTNATTSNTTTNTIPTATIHTTATPSLVSPTNTFEWLATQQQAEVHQTYLKCIESQIDATMTVSTMEEESEQRVALREATSSSTAGSNPLASTFRSFLSNLGFLSAISSNRESNSNVAAPLTLLSSSPELHQLIDHLDYSCDATSTQRLRVTILYRRPGEVHEDQIYANRSRPGTAVQTSKTTSDALLIDDSEYDSFVSSFQRSCPFELLIPSRMHDHLMTTTGGKEKQKEQKEKEDEAAQQHTASIRSFIQRSSTVRIIFAASSSTSSSATGAAPTTDEFYPSIPDLESDYNHSDDFLHTAAGGVDNGLTPTPKQTLYIHVFPISSSSSSTPSSSLNYRVKIQAITYQPQHVLARRASLHGDVPSSASFSALNDAQQVDPSALHFIVSHPDISRGAGAQAASHSSPAHPHPHHPQPPSSPSHNPSSPTHHTTSSGKFWSSTKRASASAVSKNRTAASSPTTSSTPSSSHDSISQEYIDHLLSGGDLHRLSDESERGTSEITFFQDSSSLSLYLHRICTEWYDECVHTKNIREGTMTMLMQQQGSSRESIVRQLQQQQQQHSSSASSSAEQRNELIREITKVCGLNTTGHNNPNHVRNSEMTLTQALFS